MDTQRILMTLTALSIMAFATPALAAQAMIGCETDDDCLEYKMVCGEEGYCAMPSFDACESDAECDEGFHCVWGGCTETGTYCTTAADCGEYMMCAESSATWGSSGSAGTPSDGSDGSVPSEGEGESMEWAPVECESDADCEEQGLICIDGYCGFHDEPIEPIEPAESWGECVIDPEQVPTDANCTTLCEHVGACAEAGGLASSGSAVSVPSESTDTDGVDEQADFELPPDDDDESKEGQGNAMACESDADCINEHDGEVCIDGICQRDPGGGSVTITPPSAEELEEMIGMCTALCSYAVLQNAGLDELAALNQCLEGEANDEDACAAMDACEPTAETWGEALEDAGITDDVAGAAMGGSNATLDVAGSSGGEERPTDDQDGSGSGDDSGGCGTSHAPVIPWLVLTSLGAAALLRRRQTA